MKFFFKDGKRQWNKTVNKVNIENKKEYLLFLFSKSDKPDPRLVLIAEHKRHKKYIVSWISCNVRAHNHKEVCILFWEHHEKCFPYLYFSI